MSRAPTSQKAGERPIAFILDDRGIVGAPIYLPIRPEDLTRNESMRATVHQTMGREVSGWVDMFGPSLPSCTISGNTGWRVAQGTGLDGMQAFERLNHLIQIALPLRKQAAIDDGIDPALVRLMFVDSLNSFAWIVVPTQFVLRRSKSKPLLFQYNITLQAISTSIDDAAQVDLPEDGGLRDGLSSLDDSISGIIDYLPDFDLPDLSDVLGLFNSVATDVFQSARDAISEGLSGDVVALAGDLAKAGANVARTIGGQHTMSLSSAYSNVSGLFSNSLKITEPYEDYTDLYGASNCSSTTGGRPPSPYAGENVFGLMMGEAVTGKLSSSALQSVAALRASDPVLAPMPISEIIRHIGVIVEGRL